jgi:hypothetical protein
MSPRKILEFGGYISGALLIVFGVIAIGMGVNGRSEVRTAIKDQKITATPDAKELTNGKLSPGQAITNGAEARQFAKIMEHHALEATGGKRYSEMGRFLTPAGTETSDEAAAAKTPEGRPVENGARNLWVTETALATALNMSYMAEQLSLFGIVVGVALLLTGIGLVILAFLAVRRWAEAEAPTTAKAGKPIPAA